MAHSELELKLQPMITADLETFDTELENLDQEDLVQLVKMIQSAMHRERFKCDAITQQLSNFEQKVIEQDEEKKEKLNNQLVMSQNRFAELCAKNVKSTTKKNPELHQRKTLSAIHREKKLKEQGAKPDENQVRQAVETVFEGLVGQEFQLETEETPNRGEEKENHVSRAELRLSPIQKKQKSGVFFASPTEIKSVEKEVILESPTKFDSVFSSPTLEKRVVFASQPEKHRISVESPKQKKSVDKEAIFESQRRILDQVKKAKEKGGISEAPVSPDRQELLEESTKPLRSILKKSVSSDPDMSEEEVTTKVTSFKTTTSSSTVYLTRKENVTFEETPRSANGHTPDIPPKLPDSAPPRLPTLEPPVMTMLHHANDNSSHDPLEVDGVPLVPERPPTPPPSPKVDPIPPKLDPVPHKKPSKQEEEFISKLEAVQLSSSPPDPDVVYTPPRFPVDDNFLPRFAPKGELFPKPEMIQLKHASPVKREIKLPTPTHAISRTKVEIGKNGTEKLLVEENTVCRDWDPTPLLKKLYKVDYIPRKDRKRNRFTNMEGHMDHLPLGVKIAFTEKQWKSHYFKTKEGRLYWYQTPYAEESSLGDVLLSGTDVDINRDDCLLSIHGGRDHNQMTLRCPSNLLEKWRDALLSHAASSVYDSYIQPLYPPVPHYNQKLVIIELGSASIRAGLLTLEPSLPQLFFPAIATLLPDNQIIGCESLKPEYRHEGKVVRPIEPPQPGIERYSINLNLVRDIFKQIFNDLEVDPNEYKALLTVPHDAPVSMIGELLGSLLHDLHVPAATVMRQPCLVLYAYDVTTGVVVDIGDRINIVPVVDGYVVENAIVSLPYGGGYVLDSLRAKLSEVNVGLYAFLSKVERYILRYIAEQSCYVATDYDAEVENYQNDKTATDMVVSLDKFEPTPEMTKDFTVDSARFTSTEGLFKPKRWGLDVNGLHTLLYNAIQASPMDSRRTLYRNIYLAGGGSLLPGLAERVENELSQLVASSIHVQVHISPWRYHAAYLGAQIPASSHLIEQSMITDEQLNTFLTRLHASNF